MSTTLTPSTLPHPSFKRQRARKACLPCRKRKRKCDVKYPCGMCATYGYTCSFPADEGPAAAFVVGVGGSGSLGEGFERMDDGEGEGVGEGEGEGVLGGGKGDGDGIVISEGDVVMDRGILDPVKGRYMGLHSAAAFPRNLGLDLQSANPPHLHSFAWNCGIRPEENPSTHQCLRSIVTREQFDQYSAVYWASVHPIFGILDRDQFMSNCDHYFGASPQITDFDSVISMVVALGSFFSASMGHPRESDLVQLAKTILEDPVFSRKPTIDQVAAWILRTIYLRATTRPHASWLTSSISIHLAEATGLHHEIEHVVLASNNITKTIASNDTARRLFWSAWAINTMISYEYGRSSVILNGITTKQANPTEGDFSSLHVKLAQIIPQQNQPSSSLTNATEILKAFSHLDQIPDSTHPFITLSKADLALCFYRRLRILQPGIEKKCITRIIHIGNLALLAANALADSQRFWWQVLCTVFQYVCVLLAIDTHESLSNVSSAMQTLDRISGVLGTHVAREANNTAKVLLRDSVRKKRVEVELLEGADRDVGLGDGLEGLDVGDIDWDALLDPGFGGEFGGQSFGGF